MVTETVEGIEEAPQVVEESESIQKARSLGWKPKEEYDGDKRWVDADEFLERQELYDGIHKSNRSVKKLKKVIETLVVHNKSIEEAAYQKALDTLRQEKKTAAADNDVAAVVAIDEKIDAVKEKLSTAKTGATAPAATELFEEWMEQNPWYSKDHDQFDEDMFMYASGLGHQLETEHDDWSPEKILSEVSKRTKKTFEWKFKNGNREVPNKVNSKKTATSTVETGTNKKFTYDMLPPEAQGMYRTLVKTKSNPHGVMSAEEYLADYAVAASRTKEGK